MDWRFVLFCFSIFQFIFGVVVFCVIKFNDLKHIDTRITALEEKHDSLTITLNNVAVQVSSIDGFIKGQQSKKKQV